MKYMISNKENPNNHPINVVHTDLESFILFNDSGLNDVEVEDIPEISNCIRTVLVKGKENLQSASEQSSNKAEKSSDQNQEVGRKVVMEQKLGFQHLDDENGIWTMDFDGALGKDGTCIRIWIRNPLDKPGKVPKNVRLCSYKLDFDCYDNEAEYESLITGLKILKKLGARRIAIYDDSELVIKQEKGEYQAKHPQMRAFS